MQGGHWFSSTSSQGVAMALMNCPECGAEISDQASSCPSCGFPVNRQAGLFKRLSSWLSETPSKTALTVGGVFSLLWACLFVYLAYRFSHSMVMVLLSGVIALVMTLVGAKYLYLGLKKE